MQSFNNGLHLVVIASLSVDIRENLVITSQSSAVVPFKGEINTGGLFRRVKSVSLHCVGIGLTHLTFQVNRVLPSALDVTQ